MANIKLKDNNWEASGIYDIDQQKNQRQINADVSDLKSAINTLQPAATAADVGKALIVKTVDPTTGKPSAYEYGEAGGGGDTSNCAPVIIDSASGAIASFSDGADGMPIKALTVNIEPVQDLHGQDAPYPAGGGKQLFDKDNLTALDNAYLNNMTLANGGGNKGIIIACHPSTTYTVSVQVKNEVDMDVGSFATMPAIGSTATVQVKTLSSVTDKAATITTGASDNYLFVKYNNTNKTQTYSNQQVLDGLMIEVGSTASAYAPYSNICPISGWTGAKVITSGENLSSISEFPVERSWWGVNWPDMVTVLNTLKAGSYNISFTGTIIDVDGVTSVMTQSMRIKANGTDLNIGYPAITDDAPVNGKTYRMVTPFIITPSAVGKITNCYLYFGNPTPQSFKGTITEISITVSATATDYEPYQGNTYDITFPTEAGTVYSGSLDWIAKKLKSRPYYASYNGDPLVGPWISSMDTYTPGTTPTIGAQVVDLGGAETNYDLADVPDIVTLLGTNKIWADCGPVSVDYPADTKLFIQKVNKPTDDDMTADAQIASGKYFIIGNNLYLSTTTIPAGDTIIPGTNCTKTDLAAALNALNT